MGDLLYYSGGGVGINPCCGVRRRCRWQDRVQFSVFIEKSGVGVCFYVAPSTWFAVQGGVLGWVADVIGCSRCGVRFCVGSMAGGASVHLGMAWTYGCLVEGRGGYMRDWMSEESGAVAILYCRVSVSTVQRVAHVM